MPYTVLPHTADSGIEATASSFPELLCELARGMFDLMGSPSPAVDPEQFIEVDVESTDYAELVVDALSELLYHSEVEDLFLHDFGVDATGPYSVHIRAAGVANRTVEPTGPPIKAVTYHGLAAHQTATGWYGRVYFDV